MPVTLNKTENTNNPPTNTLLTMKEVMNILSIKQPKTIYKLIKEGQIAPPIRLGKRSIRFKADEINKYISELPPVLY